MREMRRKNVSHVTVRTAPDSTSPPSTLVQRGNEKVAVHLLPHARYRLSVPANFLVWGSSPPQARASGPPQRAGLSPPEIFRFDFQILYSKKTSSKSTASLA